MTALLRTNDTLRSVRVAVAVLAGLLASGSPSLAQGSEDRVIDQAQRAVRERITNREVGRDLIVRFDREVGTDSRSNADVRVSSTPRVIEPSTTR